MPTLAEKQSGMALRQRPRPGRKPSVEGVSPAGEIRIRTAIATLWATGVERDLDQLARQFDRPRGWLKNWFDQGCPLL